MFRKISNVLRGNGTKIKHLTNMGFTKDQAETALEATNGDVDRAVELLLVANNVSNNESTAVYGTSGASAAFSSSSTTSRYSSHNNHNNNMMSEEEMIQQAMQESLKLEQQAQVQRKKKATTEIKLKKSMTPAAKAAEARAKGLSYNNNNSRKNNKNDIFKKYNYPTPMKDKTKEEQIQRLVQRLAPYPRAIDTLLIAVQALMKDPKNPKYRTIDKNTAGYKQVLEPTPSAHDLLLVLKFKPLSSHNNNNKLQIPESQIDMALLWICESSLQKVRENSEEYKQKKLDLNFAKQLSQLLTNQPDEVEIQKRLEYLQKLPTEPREESNIHNTVTIYFSSGSGDDTNEVKHRRRFDGDDQLIDIVNWCGTFSSQIPENINVSGEWGLFDKNVPRDKSVVLTKKENLNLTLQRIGCWPSGRLELRRNT